jgi:hypothetical protein
VHPVLGGGEVTKPDEPLTVLVLNFTCGLAMTWVNYLPSETSCAGFTSTFLASPYRWALP